MKKEESMMWKENLERRAFFRQVIKGCQREGRDKLCQMFLKVRKMKTEN